MRRLSLLAGVLSLLTLDQAVAQQPTQAQRDAIRASCRSDFMADCAGVQPGGKEAFDCLIRNDAKLSAACRTAVDAARPKPVEAAEPAAPAAPATPAPTAPPHAAKPEAVPAATAAADELLKAVQQACTLNDLVAHCSWIAPSNPEILLCLKANAAGLSPGCQAALQSVPAAAAPAAAAPPPSAPPAEPARRAEPAKKPAEPQRASAPPPAAAAAPAAAPPQPSEQQRAAIRAACRSDFMAHCSGVQPGGAAALQCLQRNGAALSGACKTAVAAVGGGAAAPAAGAAPAATPAAAPIGPIPPMRPREALAIVQICRAEVATVCAGIPFGGGRVLTCLAENAASLSPQCAGALRAAAAR